MYAAEPPPEREPERPRSRRSPARFLAPSALIAVVVVVVIVISSNTGSSASSNPANTGSPFSVTTAVPATALRPHRKRRATAATTESTAPGLSGAGTGTVTTGTSTTSAVTTGTSTTAAGTYTIAAGDTFAAVSAKTGVPITTIEKLNPGVSSSALTVGQVIKLK